MSTEFRIQQSEDYQGNDWWKWAVWIEGSPPDLNQIVNVEWTLHPTFPNPIRKSSNRATKFMLETGGWGTFQIRARLQMKDGSIRRLSHYLQLYYPDDSSSSDRGGGYRGDAMESSDRAGDLAPNRDEGEYNDTNRGGDSSDSNRGGGYPDDDGRSGRGD
jgi:hypothetical protein